MPALKRIVVSTAVVVSLVAISASSAAAMVVYAPSTSAVNATPHVSAVYSRQDKQVVRPATPTPSPVAPAARAPRFTAPGGGFSTTDAALTTGGVIALMLVALGSWVAVSRRRTNQRAALSH